MTTLGRIIINAKLGESKIATICKKNLIDALKRLKKASRNNTIYKDAYFGQITALTRIFYETDTETAHIINELTTQIYLGRKYRK